MALSTLRDVRGLLVDFIDKLSGENSQEWIEATKRFFRKENPWEAVAKLLRLIREVFVGGTSHFAVDSFFTTKNKRVKISFVSNDFKHIFGGLVEKGVPGLTLIGHELTQAALDTDIMAELGPDKRITKLAYVAELMSKQPDGEFGDLLTNDHANIFYAQQDASGKPWAVGVNWTTGYSAGGGGWYVSVCSVGHRYGWSRGDRVFSCK